MTMMISKTPGRNGLPSRLTSRAIIALVFVLGFLGTARNLKEMRRVLNSFDLTDSLVSDGAPAEQKKTTVAYAVTVTKFNLEEQNSGYFKHLDRAAVLHQSIKRAMQKSLRYDYHLYAFVHPDAIEAKPMLERLGYRVQIRDTPFNLTAIDNFDLVDAQRISCCAEREYLKLYTYLLLDYPVAVHLDLDTIVLKPMDEVFDFMVMAQNRARSELVVNQARSFASKYGMWMNRTFDPKQSHWNPRILESPERINFMFTRDYNMVDPPMLKPYQMGVQGGFLIVRPNRRDFDRMVDIIKSGGEFKKSMWGYETLGEDGYGMFYGAGTIQGLASYYYDYHENATRSLELNRCKYNTMVDMPTFFNKGLNKTLCRTLEETCEDCSKTPLEEIFTGHLTECGKPEYCHDLSMLHLCGQLLHEWHKTRLSLELEWMNRYSEYELPYVPHLNGAAKSTRLLGHCDPKGDHNGYIPMIFPRTSNDDVLI